MQPLFQETTQAGNFICALKISIIYSVIRPTVRVTRSCQIVKL